MQAWHRHKSTVTLVAALCFAVLSGLHVARPMVPVGDLALLGFSVEDICGYGTEGASRDCPNCALAEGGCVPAGDLDFLGVAEFVRSVGPRPVLAQDTDQALVAYQARGPPKFT